MKEEKQSILFTVFFPTHSVLRLYLQAFAALLFIFGVFIYQCNKIRNGLSSQITSGTVVQVKIGYKGGGVGKYSGRSTHYYFNLDKYRSTFYINDLTLFFENRNMSPDQFSKGQIIETMISANDIKKLNIPTDTYLNGNKIWPIRKDCVQMYGLTLNGNKILSANATIRWRVYDSWFWIFVPLFIYGIFTLIMTIVVFGHYKFILNVFKVRKN